MSFPHAPPAPKAPPPPPTMPMGEQAGKLAQRKAASAFGPGSTIMTGPAGITKPASTTRASLLGE